LGILFHSDALKVGSSITTIIASQRKGRLMTVNGIGE
jgi:hypothetical protein